MLKLVQKKSYVLILLSLIAILLLALYFVLINFVNKDVVVDYTQNQFVDVAYEDMQLLNKLLNSSDSLSEKVANELLSDVNTDKIQMLTQEIADMCKVSLDVENFDDLLSKLVGYAMRNGLSMKEFNNLKQMVLNKGSDQFFVFLSRYGLSKQESTDLLCAAAYATVHKQELQKTLNAGNEYESFLTRFDTDLDELQQIISDACNQYISKEHIAYLINTYANILDYPKNNNKDLEATNLFEYLSTLLSISENDIKATVCNDG